MASVEDIAQTLTERLDQSGILTDIRASLRHAVFQSLQTSLRSEQAEVSSEVGNKPETTPMDAKLRLCHLLIMEYLQSSGLNHTLNTFMTEASDMHSKNGKSINLREIRNTIHQEIDLNLLLGDNRNVDEQFENKSKEENIPMLFTMVDSMRR